MAPTLDSVRWFFQRYYRPDNATLVVVGDFDPQSTQAAIDRYFGPIVNPKVKVARPPAPTIVFQGSAHARVSATRQTDLVSYVWAVPKAGHRLELEADWMVLIRVLEIRLKERLLRLDRTALSVGIGFPLREGSRLFTIEAEFDRGADVEPVRRSIEQELAVVREGKLGERDFQAARRGAVWEEMMDAESYLQRAMTLAVLRAPDEPELLYDSQTVVERMRALTAGDIQRMAVSWLPSDRWVTGSRASPAPPTW